MRQLLLFISLLVSIQILFFGEINAQTHLVTEVLNELGTEKQVFFSYDDALLDNQKTDFKIDKSEKVQSALQRLFQDTEFTYEIFDKKFFVIYRKNNSIIKDFVLPSTKIPKKSKPKPGKNIFSYLMDLEEGKPIENAFIFIRNTSVSTTSDANGFFRLNVGDFPRGELVVTHLSYNTFSIPLSKSKQLAETLFLTPKQLSFATVNVNAKKLNSRKRKKWLRQFKAAFFGEGSNKRGMKLLNPEIVWFQEKDGELFAEAVDYLSIYNAALGYKLRFYLEGFRTDGEEETDYSGKVFFEDVAHLSKQNKRIRRNRNRTFQRSKKFFFRSLLENKLDTVKYQFGEAIFDDEGQLIYYNPLKMDSLTILRGAYQDTLLTANFFSFTNTKIVTKWGNLGKINNYASCFLHAKNGRIILDHSGEIVNPKEIIEVGYWTSRRLADLMPMEYNFVRPTIIENSPDDIIGNLALTAKQWPQEKVYLHLNKPYFSLTEHIWFKAYLVDAHQHQPNTLSKVVHVDLIDPDGQITKSWTLHKDKVMEGDFYFNSQHKSGDYHFRAYTQFMQNTKRDYFFQKQISVYDPSTSNTLKDTVGLVGEIAEDADSQKELIVDFFPEGGVLVENLPVNMAFKITDLEGNPSDFGGEILDDLGRLVTKIKPSHVGLGLFNYLPEKGRTYTAIFFAGAQTFAFPLPTPTSQGMVMRVNNRMREKVFIEVATEKPEDITGAFLVGHVRGQIVCFIEEITNKKGVVIDKNTIPAGLVHFTLFNRENQPIAERLIFNEISLPTQMVGIQSNTDAYQPREKVTLEIDGIEALKNWQQADISLTVTDQALVKHDTFGEHIQNYLLLNSDLRTPIPNPDFYLTDIDNSKRFWLDLWLMTHGWRRFNWENLGPQLQQELAYKPETGYSLKGYTTEKNNREKRIATQVLLSALDNNFIYETQATDEAGNFHFTNLPYLDSITFIIQARVQTKNNNLEMEAEETKMEGDRMVDFHFIQPELPEVDTLKYQQQTILGQEILAKYLSYEKHSKTLDSIYNAIWEITIDEEIVVRARRKRPFKYGNTYDLDEADWIHPNRAGQSLLAALFPRNNYILDPTEAKLYYIEMGGLDNRKRHPVSISINGMGADKEGSNPFPFLSLTADRIKYIHAGRTSINVITRAIPRSLQIKLESGILNYDHPGYAQARAFYAPNYAIPLPIHKEPDLRTAIHWSPNVKLTKGETQTVSFYTADTPTTYEVRIEGITNTGIPIFEKTTVSVSNKN